MADFKSIRVKVCSVSSQSEVLLNTFFGDLCGHGFLPQNKKRKTVFSIVEFFILCFTFSC